MQIRHADIADLPRIMEIYAIARDFMASHGNPRQWGATTWPPQALIENDIAAGHSYVCVHEAQIVGVFFYENGHLTEPVYQEITDGAWIGDDDYGVVHRIASDGSVRGVGKFCINWAFSSCGHLRIDTHGDNIVMQNLLTSLGFRQCGIIHVEEDPDPRLAYEKIK